MPGADQPLRCVVADDSPLLRAGVISVLESDGHEVVAAVDSASGLLSAVSAHDPDLVVTDVRMPPDGEDAGLRATAAIRAERPRQPVVILSQYTSAAYLGGLLDGPTDAGGLGYLLKDRVAHVRQFLDAVRAVARGATMIDPEVIRTLVGSSRQPALAALTPREREVLSLMAEGLTNQGIADRLVVSEAAVRKHVGGIFAKLPIDEGGDRRVLAVLEYLRA